MNKIAALPLVLLFVVPLLATLFFVLSDGFEAAGWHALFHHPQLLSGLVLSFATGTVTTLLAIILALIIAATFFERSQISQLTSQLSFMLAIPHLAFALGFGFLIMPSGLLARLMAWPLGWQSPPQWATSHDPYAIALTLALIAKETAFLLFATVNILSRPDIAQSFRGQHQAASGLGHGMGSIWLKLFIPQLAQHLLWPLVIVFVYASTVVDMSLVLGPTQPPVFADVIWVDINSADPANNARGAAGAVFISLLAGVLLSAVVIVTQAMTPLLKTWITRGPTSTHISKIRHSREGADDDVRMWFGLRLFYLVVIVTLIFLSFATLWPFPSLLPNSLSFGAWRKVAEHSAPLITSIILASTTSLNALIILVAWLEKMPQRFDRAILILCLLVLGLPTLLIGLGQYQVMLRLHLTGTAAGLYLAHLTPVVAYIFIMLNGPYRSFENKWRDAAVGLMASPSQFLFRIKWTMLKAPLLSSAAVGFAVSFAQFVPAQLVAAGRYSTLPMEAVTLSSGSDRALTAAFALLLMLPPLLVFFAGGYFGRSRWSVA